MGHIDEELKGQAETVLDQPGGNKDGLGDAKSRVAVADGAIAQIDSIGRSNHGLAGVGNGQRDKVIGAAAERGSNVAGTAPTRCSRSGSETRVSPHAA